LDVTLTATFFVLRGSERASSVANHAHAHSQYASSIITATEELPRFPGSLVKHEGCKDIEVNNCWQELRADRPLNEVIQYYKDALQNDGWVINTEHNRDDSTSLELLKSAPAGIAPMRRRLTLSISQWGETGASIDLSWERWPNPYKVPNYPDAEDVQRHWDQSTDPRYPCTSVKQVTAFTTSATFAAILGYYRTIMPLHGWTLAVEISPTSKSFVYSRRFEEGFISSNVLLDIQPVVNDVGVRKVQLSVSSYEFTKYCVDHNGNMAP
jgi:hypothetical protein